MCHIARVTSSDLLSTRDVAERKNVTTTTVARWVAAGRLTPAFQGPGIRGAMFFTPASVDALDDDATADVA